MIQKNSILLTLIISGFLGLAFSYSDIYFFHLVFSSWIVLSLYQFKQNSYKINIKLFSNLYIKAFLAIFSWYLLSLLWTPDLYLGLKYIFYLICGMGLVLSIIHYSKNIKYLNKIFKVLSIFVSIELCISLIESFTKFRMPISSYSQLASFFGKDPINASEIAVSFIYGSFIPPTGFRWNTNDLAICMALSLPFFLNSKKTFLKIFGITSIITIIVMAASRAAFLGVLLIFIFYFMFIKKRIGALLFIWAIMIVSFFGIQELQESENPRINEVANSTKAISMYLKGDIDIGGSIEWRRELVQNGLLALKRTYGFGIGAGGTVANQLMIGPVAGQFTSMHNFWIELLVEGGIVVALIMSLWLIAVTYNLFLISKQSTNEDLVYYGKSLFLSYIGFFPAAIAASSTIYFLPMWIMFGFSTSVILLSKA